MKRSHQDAIVGFTLLGGLVLFSGLLIWLQGLRIGRNDWTIAAIFDNASGLSEGTPVTYRGIKVGSIENIKFNYKEVKAKIRINNKNLILFKPAYAKIKASSVLGRDIEVSLLSKGEPIEDIINLPNQKDCQKNLIVCEGDVIKGKEINSISTLTEGLNELLNQADEEKLVPKMLESISQFDQTQEELEELIKLSRQQMHRAKPIITELRKSVTHINNILAVIDDPETMEHMKVTASSISSTTQKIDQLASDISEIINDEELTTAIQSAAIGIGKLFNDLYP